MNESLVFRIVFAALFLLLFGVVTAYRVRAQAGRKFDYSKEGRALFLVLLPALRRLPAGPGLVVHRAAIRGALGRSGAGVAADPVHRVGAAGAGAQRLADRFLLAGAFFLLVLLTIRLPKEEAELEKRFGQAYRDYVRRTGRFLP